MRQSCRMPTIHRMCPISNPIGNDRIESEPARQYAAPRQRFTFPLFMNALLESLLVPEGASWTYFHRQLEESIPLIWHYHLEFELTLTVNSLGQRYVGDSIESYGDGDLVLLGSNLPHTWMSQDTSAPAGWTTPLRGALADDPYPVLGFDAAGWIERHDLSMIAADNQAVETVGRSGTLPPLHGIMIATWRVHPGDARAPRAGRGRRDHRSVRRRPAADRPRRQQSRQPTAGSRERAGVTPEGRSGHPRSRYREPR